MKKLFIVGAVIASMAFSSVASAAVSYGEGNLALTYAPATNALTIDDASIAGLSGQKSVIVKDSEGEIFYVDQTNSAATSFGTMKLKGEELSEGVYEVKASSENSNAILSNTFTLAVQNIALTVTPDGNVYENGYVWLAEITKGEADINGFSATFGAGSESVTKSVSNVDAMTGFDGEGVLSFYVGLKTDKALSAASFTVSDANGSATDAEGNI